MAVTSRAVFRTINLNDLVERFDAPSIVLEWGFAPSNSPAGAPFCCSTQRSNCRKFLKSTPPRRRVGDTSGRNLVAPSQEAVCIVAAGFQPAGEKVARVISLVFRTQAGSLLPQLALVTTIELPGSFLRAPHPARRRGHIGEKRKGSNVEHRTSNVEHRMPE